MDGPLDLLRWFYRLSLADRKASGRSFSTALLTQALASCSGVIKCTRIPKRLIWKDMGERLKERLHGLSAVLKARMQRLVLRFILVLRLSRTAFGRYRLRISAYARFPGFVWVLAILYRRTLIRRVRLVVVVGSFGKTTTTRAIGAALGVRSPSCRVGNSGVALADALLRIRPGDRYAVVEVGIGGKGRMEVYARRLRADIAVVTCIGSEHLTSFGTLEVTRSEKAKMVASIKGSGRIVLNGDDPNVMWMEDSARVSVVTYGFNPTNRVRASRVIDHERTGVRFTLHLDKETREVSTRLLGKHQVAAGLAAMAIAQAEGLDTHRSLSALEALEPTLNRLQPICHPSGAWVLLDAFKGALETIDAALATLSRLPARRKVVVLGDVEEPPGSQGPIYKALGLRLADTCDRVLFVGGKTNLARLRTGTRAGGLPNDAVTNIRTNPRAILEELKPELRPSTTILIKGRSTQHLERVALLLSGESVACSRERCAWRHACSVCPLRGD